MVLKICSLKYSEQSSMRPCRGHTVEFNAYFLISKIISNIRNLFLILEIHFVILEIHFLILENTVRFSNITK